MTRLSIVVPCLDEEQKIVGALDALQPLRDRGAEVIVVDGGSNDHSVELARPRADHVIVTRRGRAHQMNAGAAVAHGDVLLFLHADSRLPQDADSLVLAALLRARRWGRFDVAIEGRHPLLRVVACLMNLRSRWTAVATGDQAIFVTREAFEALGGYRDIALMEDIDLSARLKRLTRPACIREPVVTSGRRWERHGVLRTIVLMWRLRLAYACGADPAKLAIRYGYRD